MQAYSTPISAERFIEDVREQFRISHEAARMLIKTIFHLTKDAAGKDALEEIKKDLPEDWRSAIVQA